MRYENKFILSGRICCDPEFVSDRNVLIVTIERLDSRTSEPMGSHEILIDSDELIQKSVGILESGFGIHVEGFFAPGNKLIAKKLVAWCGDDGITYIMHRPRNTVSREVLVHSHAQ